VVAIKAPVGLPVLFTNGKEGPDAVIFSRRFVLQLLETFRSEGG